MAKGGAKGGLASEPPPSGHDRACRARVAEPHATAVYGAPPAADAMAEIAEPPTPRDDSFADGDDDALMMAEEPVEGDDDHQAKRARMLQQGDANVPEPPPSQPLFESLRDSLFGPSAPVAEGSAALVEEGDEDEYDDVQSRSTHDAYGDDFDETETLGSRQRVRDDRVDDRDVGERHDEDRHLGRLLLGSRLRSRERRRLPSERGPGGGRDARQGDRGAAARPRDRHDAPGALVAAGFAHHV